MRTFAKTVVATPLALAACMAGPVPVMAADGEIVITQDKAMAGKITPLDAPGFPITLSSSGSYRLGSNIQVPAGANGIVIAALNVTLDLNGFTVAGGAVADTGIVETVASHQDAATIRNGTVFGFRRDGIRTTGQLWTIEKMRVWYNGGNGISGGPLTHVSDSTLFYNKMKGIVAGNQSSIEDSIVTASGGDGIECPSHCLVSGNVVSGNGQMLGGVGVKADLSTVVGNTISYNKGFGIEGNCTGAGNNTLVINNNSGGGVEINTGVLPMTPNGMAEAC